MPLDVKKIFLFNSGLPEPGKTPLAFSRDLGPWEGNFRGRNIGNGYISHATLRGLFGKPVRLDHEANGWTCKIDDAFVSRINSEYSHFVFVMQDFIRESFAGQPFGRMADLMERLTIPVVPLSLGANALDGFDPALPARLSADQVRFVNVLSHKAASIGVRGAYTADVLNQMGIKNVVVTGCPSFFENGATPARIKRVAFDPGKVVTTGAYFPHQAPSAPHILQDELFFINAMYLRAPDAAPEAWLDDSSQSRPFDTEALGVTYGLYERAFSGRLKFFSHFDTWRKTTRDGGFCMTVGSRLHAAIQSWNSGVPGVVTNGDARASETCAYHGIPHRPDLRDTSDLRAVYGEIDLDAVKRNYPAGRKTFLDYMRANGIVPEDYDTSGETFVYPDYAQDMGADAAAALSAGYRRTWAYNESLLRAGLDRQSTLKSLTAEVEGQRAALARAAEMEAQRLARAAELEREAATRAGEVVALACAPPSSKRSAGPRRLSVRPPYRTPRRPPRRWRIAGTRPLAGVPRSRRFVPRTRMSWPACRAPLSRYRLWPAP